MVQRQEDTSKTCEWCGRYIGRGDWWDVSLSSYPQTLKWTICIDCLNTFVALIGARKEVAIDGAD